MTLLYTLTVGGVLWAVALHWTYPRAFMGRGGTVVYLAVFLFVAWLSLVNASRRGRELDTGAPVERSRSLLGSLVLANLVAAAVLGLLAVAFGVLRVGENLVNAWIFGAMVGVLVFPLAWLVGRLARSRAPSPEPSVVRRPPILRPLAVLAALLPMLAPFVALVALLTTPLDAWWESRLLPAGRAGILYQVMLPLFLPTAVLVAWGLDRVDGSRTGTAGRVVVSLSAAVLVLAAFFLPGLLWSIHGLTAESPGEPALPLRLVFPDLAETRPFFYLEPPGSGDETLRPLPLDSLFRGAAAMMFATALLSAYSLRRLGRGIQALTPLHVGVFFALQIGASVFGMPRYGPQMACWSAALAAVIVFLWAVLGTRPPEPAAAPEPA